jgi:hypothetical protein
MQEYGRVSTTTRVLVHYDGGSSPMWAYGIVCPYMKV